MSFFFKFLIQTKFSEIYLVSGQGDGFDVDLVKQISEAVSIPVIASSGAGKPEHFSQVFQKTGAAAALAAGIFHRKEVNLFLFDLIYLIFGFHEREVIEL